MNIADVKTAFKICDVLWDGKSERLTFKYLDPLYDENGNEIPQDILKENLARVYLIVVDGLIYKIGGSQDKGGIKGTLNIYQTGGVNGRPSIRSFGIWYFLFHAITHNHKIEFYMIYQDNFEAKVKGLFGYHTVPNASLNYKLLEECCEEDYKSKENGNYPKWNIQEQGGDWPPEVKEAHLNVMELSRNKATKTGRKKIDGNIDQ